MSKVVDLRQAVAGLVRDGDAVAMEGFTHLIPTGAAHEIIRQKRRDFTLIRMMPDLIYDRLIGMGCAAKLIFSWGGNPGVGSLRRFRDAVEHAWPRPLEIEKHPHAGMANRYGAGASGLPFAVLRGYLGTDLPNVTPTIKPITRPSRARSSWRPRPQPRRGDHPRPAGRREAQRRPLGHHRHPGRGCALREADDSDG